MTRTPTSEIVAHASRNGYAVPAINVVDSLSMRAVCAAAEQANSPVIIQTSVKTVRALGAPYLSYAFDIAAGSVETPVGLHLDHCPDRAVISDCLENGWDSVLFDASDRPLHIAQAETIEVVNEARAHGAAVESEIENIAGIEDGVGVDVEGARYDVDTLTRFVRSVGCDFFAPALGTAHGMYKRRPRLDPGRAGVLSRALQIPLVLHGGTGLTANEFSAFIRAGCAKVNISTSLKEAYMKSALAFLEEARAVDRWDPPSLFAAMDESIQNDVTVYFEQFGSAARSREPW